MKNLRWKIDIEKYVILVNCNRRGWHKTHSDTDWHIYWANASSVKHMFHPKTGYRLGENQLVNHFPNYHELTRKDLMVKNIKRFRKETEKLGVQVNFSAINTSGFFFSGSNWSKRTTRCNSLTKSALDCDRLSTPSSTDCSTTNSRPASSHSFFRQSFNKSTTPTQSEKTKRQTCSLSNVPLPVTRPNTSSGCRNDNCRFSNLPSYAYRLHNEFIPTTYFLPTDYSLFVNDFRQHPNTTWIMKPANKAQGKGIFLVSKLNQLKKWASPSGAGRSNSLSSIYNPFAQTLTSREPYIISRYIEKPLLIGGRKFDLRLYVLVTSYRPLKAYLYRGGFARFCQENYTTDIAEFANLYIHLTNVSVQKHSEAYNKSHGGKWSIENLRLYLESTLGVDKSSLLFRNVIWIVIFSLKSAQRVMIHDKHCFECYGYDILIDHLLKPWLMEINASPSLSATTEEDRRLKIRLINDVFDVVIHPNHLTVTNKLGASWNPAKRVGDFDLIFDEGDCGSATGDA